MKTVVTVSLLMLLAVVAQAGVIYDVQTGVYPENTYLTPIELVVVEVTPDGIFVSEPPHGAYNGIWVFTGPHSWVPGNFVSICSVYNEFEGLSQFDVVGTGTWGSVTFANGYGASHVEPIPEPSVMTAAELLSNEEMWESCLITISDGMAIGAEDLGDGEWNAVAQDGNVIRFDDFWVELDDVDRGLCYPNATGIYFYSRGNFKLEALSNGIDTVNCSVDTEEISLSAIKAMYR